MAHFVHRRLEHRGSSNSFMAPRLIGIAAIREVIGCSHLGSPVEGQSKSPQPHPCVPSGSRGRIESCAHGPRGWRSRVVDFIVVTSCCLEKANKRGVMTLGKYSVASNQLSTMYYTLNRDSGTNLPWQMPQPCFFS